MIVLTHVLIAITSLLYTGYLFFLPSQIKLRISYGLVILTLMSGIYLVMSTHAPLLSACTIGLLYLSVVLGGVLAAHKRLERL